MSICVNYTKFYFNTKIVWLLKRDIKKKLNENNRPNKYIAKHSSKQKLNIAVSILLYSFQRYKIKYNNNINLYITD